MRNAKTERLTRFIESQRLRDYVYDNNIDLAEQDPEIINLVFQLETASEQLENKIKLMYIKDYYG